MSEFTLTPVDYNPFAGGPKDVPDQKDQLIRPQAPTQMSGDELLNMLGAIGGTVAPNASSLLAGEAPPPIKNLPETGKVPSTQDPRYAGAAGEAGELAQNFLPFGAAKAAMAIPLLGMMIRRGPEAEGAIAKGVGLNIGKPKPQGYRAANENLDPLGGEGTFLDAARRHGYGSGTFSDYSGEGFVDKLISDLTKEKVAAQPLREVESGVKPKPYVPKPEHVAKRIETLTAIENGVRINPQVMQTMENLGVASGGKLTPAGRAQLKKLLGGGTEK